MNFPINRTSNKQMKKSAFMALLSASARPGLNMVWRLWAAFFFSPFSLHEQEMEKEKKTLSSSPLLAFEVTMGVALLPHNGRMILFRICYRKELTNCPQQPRAPAGGKVLSLPSGRQSVPLLRSWSDWSVGLTFFPNSHFAVCFLLPLSQMLFANAWSTYFILFIFFSTCRYNEGLSYCYYY